MNLEKYISLGLTEHFNDNKCEQIAESLGNDAVDVILARDKIRDEVEERIVYIVTLGQHREQHHDLEDALNAAEILADEMAEGEDLDTWGDGMATGWGVCPEGCDGAYWPQVHAELDGRRIDCLPWEE